MNSYKKPGKSVSIWLLVVIIMSTLKDARAVCPDPEIPKDGWRSSPNKHVFNAGDTIHYYCKSNYTLSGAPKVLCLDDGTWDRLPPICKDPCGNCDNDGLCVYQASGDKFKCICKSGYRGEHCRIPYCSKPKSVENGGYYVKAPAEVADFDVGTELIFHCDIGYRLNGNNNIRCMLTMDGITWSSKFPFCERKKCKNPLGNMVLSNGHFTPRYATYSIGDIVTFTCDAGFELRGSTSVKCLVSGFWSSVTWPRCIQKLCPAPPVIRHGKVIFGHEQSTAGTIVRYTCMKDQGFYLYGSQRQTCVADSNGDMIWTPHRPECVTKTVFEQYCSLQGKTMSDDSMPSCVHKTAVFGGESSVRRNTSIDTLTIVTGTAGGLLGFLLVIIAFVICQRRRLVRRMRLASSRRARSAEDERMLIYCSNDFHFFLPSYDEAMRSRPAEPPPFDSVVEDNNTEQNIEGQVSEVDQTLPISQNQSRDEHQYEAIENVLHTDNSRPSIEEADSQSMDNNRTELAVVPSTVELDDVIDNTQLENNFESRPSSDSISSSDCSVHDESQPLC